MDDFLAMKSMKKPIRLKSNICRLQRSIVTMNLYAHYSWGKTYPKVYNLFGFCRSMSFRTNINFIKVLVKHAHAKPFLVK